MTARGPVVVVGDTILDRDIDGDVHRVCPDAPAPVLEQQSAVDRPGGAGLAAVLAAIDGNDVVLVTALADDDAGSRLRELFADAGVTVRALPLAGATPEKIRLRAHGHVLLRLDRGDSAPAPPGPVPAGTLDILGSAAAILVSDYGRGVAGYPPVRSALEAATGPVVWDPHPRGPEPIPGVRLATPNEAEARRFAGTAAGTGGGSLAAVAGHGRTLRQRWGASAVAVTLGSRGAVLCQVGPTPLVVPAVPAAGDTCGAGDRFASSAAVALAGGAVVSEAVQYAVGRASAYVAGGGATAVLAAPPVFPTQAADDAARLVADVRARGGTVVATGGCFDLLHAGHVATLQAARGLGDCLVVCLNSDRSVRRLKGPDRPLTAAADRARLLAALDCVDAVVVFDEPTPERVLAALRPDIWVKGGDYADGGPDLPEAALVSSWGGQTVVVPYLDGRSTTSMIAAVRQSEGAA